MKPSHKPADDDQAATPQGETVPVMSEGRAPRLPHERDESSSSQNSAPRDVIRQAHKDVKAGIKDDDLGPPMDDTYAREFRSEDDTSGAADAQPPEKGGPQSGPRVHRA
jgi:hypothetical protein